MPENPYRMTIYEPTLSDVTRKLWSEKLAQDALRSKFDWLGSTNEDSLQLFETKSPVLKLPPLVPTPLAPDQETGDLSMNRFRLLEQAWT